MNTSERFSIRTFSRNKPHLFFGIGILSLFLFALAGIAFGSVSIPLSDVIRVFLKQSASNSSYATIVYHVRLPRTLAAILAGAALTTSGAILQTVLNNRLASPNIIGVNAGAGVCTILCAALFPSAYYLKQPAAFLGAILAIAVVYRLARLTDSTRSSIILSGIAVSAFCNALIDTILILFPTTMSNRVEFTIGSFSGISMKSLLFPAMAILPSLLLCLLVRYDLNLLAHGEEEARSLGMNVAKFRGFLFVLVALLTGSAVSFAGIIGFVGLIVPHVARQLVGNDAKVLIPTCIILGADFALLCDLLARVLFAPFEVPVGILMSFIGAPFFIFLLIKRKRGVRHD